MWSLFMAASSLSDARRGRKNGLKTANVHGGDQPPRYRNYLSCMSSV